MKKVLVVAAHPDDEVLGCGASIAKHAARGDEVRILILAQGLYSRGDSGVSSGEMEKLRDNARSAAKLMGAKAVDFSDFPDNKMDSVPLLEVVKVIEAHIRGFSPDIIYTHHDGDVNVDHSVTHRAVITAARPVPGQCVKTLFFFEVLSSTEWQANSSKIFTPNHFVEVGAFLETKTKALSKYEGELRDWPHSRSVIGVESLARFRGCSVGVEAAEAFICGRHLEN